MREGLVDRRKAECRVVLLRAGVALALPVAIAHIAQLPFVDPCQQPIFGLLPKGPLAIAGWAMELAFCKARQGRVEWWNDMHCRIISHHLLTAVENMKSLLEMETKMNLTVENCGWIAISTLKYVLIPVWNHCVTVVLSARFQNAARESVGSPTLALYCVIRT